ncbi:hypothetical protein TSA66_11305 [Noviherbaspirillum autotrophicum]|uniref:Uncharacterized protein n=1 Tax=Noviherbaspirillum autotrophicum TaxID=709839 RepID=A0A0C1Y2G7_9BURK|nr:hypothetical protein TSA66_11305 [Noviherbaspirillum autotrophicum]
MKQRTSDEIIHAADDIDWMVNEYYEQCKSKHIQRILEIGGWELGYLPEEYWNEAGVRELIENWPAEADDPPPFIPGPENTSDVVALTEIIGQYDLSGDPEFPQASEHEYFAVLALELVGWFVHHAQQPPDLNRAGWCAIEAMDALCYAERLQQVAGLLDELSSERNKLSVLKGDIESASNEKAKEKISLQAAKAARKRHEETDSMRQEVIDYWEQHINPKLSAEKAALGMAGAFPLSHRTVRDYIAAHKKTLKVR